MKTAFERYMLVQLVEVDGAVGEELHVVSTVNLPWVQVVSPDGLVRKMHHTRLCLPEARPASPLHHWHKPGQMGGVTNHVVTDVRQGKSRFIIFSTMTEKEEEEALNLIQKGVHPKGGQTYPIKNEKHMSKLITRWQGKGYVKV